MGCESNDDLLFIGYDRLHQLPGQFSVARCKTCGLIRTNPRPTRETIGCYYPDEYGPFQTGIQPQKPNTSNLWKRAFHSVIKYNYEPVPPIPPGHLLEVGCAGGRFMYTMAQQGWQVAGIEPDSKSAEKARALGYSVYTGTLEDAPKPPLQYDLVVGWMVVEHLHAPVASLRKLHEWVKPGGWLAISVPNAASLEFRIFKDAWFALQVPTHISHFTPRTITQILQHSGWKVERIFHHRNLCNLAISLGYKMQDWGYPNNRLTHALLNFETGSWRKQQMAYPLAFLMSLLGQTGRMSIWARKTQ